MTLMALANGSTAFLVVVLLLLGGLIYGMFTRVGSGIDHHPHDGSAGRDEGDGSAFDDHGTR